MKNDTTKAATTGIEPATFRQYNLTLYQLSYVAVTGKRVSPPTHPPTIQLFSLVVNAFKGYLPWILRPENTPPTATARSTWCSYFMILPNLPFTLVPGFLFLRARAPCQAVGDSIKSPAAFSWYAVLAFRFSLSTTPTTGSKRSPAQL